MFIVKVSENELPTCVVKIRPGGEQDQGHWVVLHNQEEGYQSRLTFSSYL